MGKKKNTEGEAAQYRIRRSVCVCGCKVFKIEGKYRICVLCREKGRDEAD